MRVCTKTGHNFKKVRVLYEGKWMPLNLVFFERCMNCGKAKNGGRPMWVKVK